MIFLYNPSVTTSSRHLPLHKGGATNCNFSAHIVGDGVLDVPHTQLSHIGKVINKYVISIDATYTDISVKKYVIMPNHIHLLILIDSENSNSANLSVPSLISTLKRFVNCEIGFNVWQRSYHDHVIRNVRDYGEIWQYIDENPFRWESDCYY